MSTSEESDEPKRTCWYCGDLLIWGGDHDVEDFDQSPHQVVSNLSCQGCGSFYLFYWGKRDG